MHEKSNRITYRFNETEQQLLEINSPNINKKQNEEKELKRAFTIVPMPTNEETLLEPIEHDKDEWPNIEQLEALIRGEETKSVNNDAIEQEQLELPLQFKTDYGTNVIEHINPETKSHNDLYANAHHVEYEAVHPVTYEDNQETKDIELASPYAEEFYYKPSEVVEQKAYNVSVAWGKVAAAISSSIITGVLIGYVLLLAVYGVKVWPINIISSQLMNQTDVNDVDSVTTTLPQMTDDAPLVDTAKETEPATVAAVTDGLNAANEIVMQPMQSFTYTVLQAGVFTKEDTKQALIDRLQASGYPATSINTHDGKMIVFAGIASDTQSTFQVNHMKDIELYRKSFSVHAPKLSEDAIKDEQLQQWVYNAHDLMSSSMKMSEAQFEQTGFSAIYKDSYQLLADKHNAFTKETEQLALSLGDDAQALHLKWHLDQFKLIYEQWNAYQEKPSLSPLLNIQNSLLSIVSYQSEWFEN